MSRNYLSITESFDVAWDKFKQKAIFFIGISMLSSVFSAIAESERITQYGIGKEFVAPNFTLLNFIGLVLSAYISLGIWKVCIKHLRGEEVELSNLLAIELKTFINYIIASIISILVIFVGFILLIIPGIHFAYRLMLVPAFIVDKNQSFDIALKSSWETTKGHTFKLFLWSLLAFLVVLMGFIALFVGIFVAIPVISLALAYIYLKLTESESLTIE